VVGLATLDPPYCEWHQGAALANKERSVAMRLLFGLIPLLGLLVIGEAAAQDRGKAPPAPPPPPGAAPKAKPLQFDLDGFFKDYDKNRDGYLQREELPPDLQRAFPQLDRNKDGRLSREELSQGILHLQPRRRPSDVVYVLIEMSDCDEDCTAEVQRAYDILRKLDTNKNGKIDPEELKAERERIIKHRVDSLFKQLDANNDGRISREEAKGQIREHFDEIDRNRDGFIEPAELLKAASERPATTPVPPDAGGRPRIPPSRVGASPPAPPRPPVPPAPPGRPVPPSRTGDR
jgi:Ca2+-binding EF-hand superfamily protein